MIENPIPPFPKWLQDIDPKLDRIPFHLQHPEIGTDEYIHSQHFALGAEVLKKRRIYLDQMYWNYCRDAVRGKPQHPLHPIIYETLRDAVSAGKLLCPASHLILEETLKQEDHESRRLTATIVQELSAGVALQPFTVLFQTEILHFLSDTPLNSFKLHPCEQMVWTHIGNVFGHMTPASAALSADTERAIQKAWFDLMASIQFPTLADSLFPVPTKMLHTPPEFYSEQNQQCAAHENDFSSYPEVFLIELAGVLNAYRNELRDALVYLYQKKNGQSCDQIPEDQLAEITRKLSNLIYHAFRLNRITRQLPGLRVMAGIHAGIRHKRQKHRKGDRHDHLHARVALPYCNAFLTEKTLGGLLTSKPLEYDKLYNCRIAWTPEDVLDAIRATLDQTEEPTGA